MIATLLLLTAFHMPPQKSDATIGVAAIHLESGERVSVRGNERFPMGSVYKFPIALTLLRRVDVGAISLQRTITIEPKDFAPGWSPLRDGANGEPITLTVGELARHMVANSDNTASDALLRLVGGSFAVSTRMAELGFGGIRVDRSETQMAADLRKPNGRENYAIDVRDTTTPEDMAALLFAFWRGRDGLSVEKHEMLLRWMIETKTGPKRIVSAVPAGSVVAHKTGTMPGTVNDVGIVTSPDGENHYVIAIFTKASKQEGDEAEEDIAAITRAILSAMQKR